MDVDLKLGF